MENTNFIEFYKKIKDNIEKTNIILEGNKAELNKVEIYGETFIFILCESTKSYNYYISEYVGDYDFIYISEKEISDEIKRVARNFVTREKQPKYSIGDIVYGKTFGSIITGIKFRLHSKQYEYFGSGFTFSEGQIIGLIKKDD